MEKNGPIEEARRYVANAAEIIKKANYDPELKIYMDSKYVKMAAAKRDRKLLAAIVAGYETMHLYMGYDGTRNKDVCNSGFAKAKAIIDQCAKLCPETQCA